MLVKIFLGVAALILALMVTGALLPSRSELKHEVRIAASASKVWQILADLEAVQHYNQTVKAAHRIGEKKELGAMRGCDLKDGGSVKETVVGFEEGKAITMELTESPWPVRNMQWRTSLTKDGGETVVSQIMTYEMKLGPIGKLLNAVVMKSKINKTIGEVFLNLKKYAESKN
jgi:carbon monoxide dehydrogenase subunit G